jgi:hypothetical protein
VGRVFQNDNRIGLGRVGFLKSPAEPGLGWAGFQKGEPDSPLDWSTTRRGVPVPYSGHSAKSGRRLLKIFCKSFAVNQ